MGLYTKLSSNEKTKEVKRYLGKIISLNNSYNSGNEPIYVQTHSQQLRAMLKLELVQLIPIEL